VRNCMVVLRESKGNSRTTAEFFGINNAFGFTGQKNRRRELHAKISELIMYDFLHSKAVYIQPPFLHLSTNFIFNFAVKDAPLVRETLSVCSTKASRMEVTAICSGKGTAAHSLSSGPFGLADLRSSGPSV